MLNYQRVTKASKSTCAGHIPSRLPGFETSTVGVATVGRATTSFAARVACRPLASSPYGGDSLDRQKKKEILTSFVNDSGQVYKDMQFETHSSDQV